MRLWVWALPGGFLNAEQLPLQINCNFGWAKIALEAPSPQALPHVILVHNLIPATLFLPSPPQRAGGCLRGCGQDDPQVRQLHQGWGTIAATSPGSCFAADCATKPSMGKPKPGSAARSIRDGTSHAWWMAIMGEAVGLLGW